MKKLNNFKKKQEKKNIASVKQQSEGNIKRFGRYIIISAFLSIFVALLDFLRVKVITNLLLQKQVGYIMTLMSVGRFVAVLSFGSFKAPIQKYFKNEKTSTKFKINDGLIWSTFFYSELILVLVLVIVGFLDFIGVNFLINILGAEIPFYILFPFISSLILYYISITIIDTENNLKWISILTLTRSFLCLIMTYFGLVFIKKTIIVVIALLISFGLAPIIIILTRIRSNKIRFLNIVETIEVLKFGFPVFIYDLLERLVPFGMIFFSTLLKGPELSAVIGVGITIVTTFEILSTNRILQIYYPFILKNHQKNPSIRKVSHKFTVLFFILTIILVIWFYIGSPVIIVLISNQTYMEAIYFVPLAILSLILIKIGKMNGIGIWIDNKTYLEVFIMLVSLSLFYILLLLLTPNFGTLGVGISNLIYGFLTFILYSFIGQKMHFFGIKIRNFLMIIIIALISIFTGNIIVDILNVSILSNLDLYFPYWFPSLDLLFLGFLTTIIFVISCFLFKYITISDIKMIKKIALK